MNFDEFYEKVHGNLPFPWQSRLAAQVCAGSWPKTIALPTAAGKTACIDIAVFALACGAKEAPRRIFFVVDRRIVVDQAYRHAEGLAKKLQLAKDGILKQVADKLRAIAQDDRPLDVYALRGGMYRETAWTRSPLQPTVIASTVDQVGSRLLFRGYGVSDSMKPVHAGLVGNDALILLDEAHCAKPFQQTAEAVKQYRKWNERTTEKESNNRGLNESPPWFKFVSITATPTDEIREAERKRAEEHPNDAKLIFEADNLDRDHEILGERLKASKPAKLMLAKKNKLLDVLKEQAVALMGTDLGTDKHDVTHSARAVGIIVNRVKSARELAKLLSEVKAKKGEVASPHDVILLTGRMRPVDRDIVFKQLAPLFSGSKTKLERPTFVVATQCLEVGADLDFHALVTECASLDSLRQRFGRLNRVADRPSAKAVIVCREEFCEPKEKEKEQDPIYGNSLPNTWKFLTDEGKRTEFDFGVSAVDVAVTGVDLTEMNAPSADAPVLFPAHLDCWVQTNPIPTPDPDPALFLHGPKQPGQPDVQVVFRSDLGDKKELWAEIVGLCPPSSSEAVAVPISLFKKWLAGENFDDNTGDVEGGVLEEEKEIELKEPQIALCWKGPESEETDTIEDPKDVRPNRTYVVPCSAKDVGKLGDFATDPPADFAEEAFQKSRDKALLRFPGLVLDEESETFDADLLDAIRNKIAKEYPGWHERAIQSLTAKKKRIVETYPAPLKGFVVRSKKRLGLCDPTYLDDSEPGDSFKGEPVSLADHSRGVADCAAKFAAGCGLPVELYYQAGLLHDLGKLDPRFQAMLRQSSPRTAVGKPLAKSANGPRNKRERDDARLVHRYPSGARHELLSCAILESSDDDLMHLIATHHGSARPFADAVVENEAASSFEVDLFEFKREMPTSKQEIATWNAELPERFWRMVRKHGWWGSAYREAAFRLADHAQSRAEQEDGWKPATGQTPPAKYAAKAAKAASYPLPLPGLDGSNPLAFLAALGTLRLANEFYPNAKLRWCYNRFWHPVLELPVLVAPDEFLIRLHTHLHHPVNITASQSADDLDKVYRKTRKATESAKNAIKSRKLNRADHKQAISEAVHPLQLIEHRARRDWLEALESAVPAPFLSLGKSIAVSDKEFATFANRAAERLHELQDAGKSDASFVSAFGCEACTDRNGRVIPTEFQLITGSGHQYFLETFGSLMESITVEQLRRSMFGPWTYRDPRLSFRWEPMDDRRYAVSWEDPSSTVASTEHGANLLAANALPLFPVAPGLKWAETTGFHSDRDFTYLTWPIWETPQGVDVTRSFLQSKILHVGKPMHEKWKNLGIRSLFRIRKYEVGTPPLSKWNVSTSVAI